MILGPLQSLELILVGAVATNQLLWTAFINERTDSSRAADVNDTAHGTTNNTTAVVAASAPASGKHRTVRFIVENRDTATAVLIVRINYNGTRGEVFRVSLDVGDKLNYEGPAAWYVRTADGSLKTSPVPVIGFGYFGEYFGG